MSDVSSSNGYHNAYAKFAARRGAWRELIARSENDPSTLTATDWVELFGDNVVPLRPSDQWTQGNGRSDTGFNDNYVMTFFPNQYAKSLKVETLTLQDLANRIVTTTAKEKADLPFVKFATFNGKVNPANPKAGCLRYDDGVVEITGIEGDKDDAPLGFEEAGDKLEAAGLPALLYTSASHTEEKPRFRVICPTSRPLPPSARTGLMQRLNGVLDGALSPESFTLSQAFYFGSVKGTSAPHICIINGGRYIDQHNDLDASAIGKGQTAEKDDYYSDSKWATFAAKLSKKPLDVDQTLADMWHRDGHGNIRLTQLRVIAALLLDGVSADEAGERVLARTMQVSKETEDIQVKRLKGMIDSWLRKHPALRTTAYPESAKATVPATLCLTLADWTTRDLPEPDYLMGELMSTTTRMLLAADTGLGKTLFAIAFGMRSALGVDFLHWNGRRPSRVLYIDGEMSRRLLRRRLVDEITRVGTMPDTFFALSREDLPGMQPLNTKAGQKIIEAVIDQHCGGSIDLFIFDNIMSLISGNHSEEEAWSETMPWIRDLTRRAIGQMWVHHTGHDTSRQYGTKLREWEMDTYMQLDKTEDENTDVSFTLSFRKARDRTPENRSQFAVTDIQLLFNKWEYQAGIKKEKLSPVGDKFFKALNAATKFADIKSALGFPMTTIEKWKEHCVTVGLIDPAGNPHNARTLFARHKLELITRNWIGCDETTAWVLP
jgi:hypothetical protein